MDYEKSRLDNYGRNKRGTKRTEIPLDGCVCQMLIKELKKLITSRSILEEKLIDNEKEVIGANNDKTAGKTTIDHHTVYGLQ